jgi:hypothetical protein
VLLAKFNAPEAGLMVNPAGALNVPPRYPFVPVKVTDAEVCPLQKGVPG